MEPSLADIAKLTDPWFFGSEPWHVFNRLQAESPVYWCEAGEFWALSKYDDVKFVSRSPDLFSSQYGMVVSASLPADDGSEVPATGMPRRAELRKRISSALLSATGAESLIMSDPPRHSILRRLVASAFLPRIINDLERAIQELTTQVLDKIEPGTVINVVEDVAVPISQNVIATALGIPLEDIDRFRRWSDAVSEASSVLSDEDSEELRRRNEQLIEMAMYFAAIFADRRANPRNDLVSTLASAEVDGERLSEPTQLAMAVLLLAAGNETTRTLIAGSLRLLAENPDQTALLRDDRTLVPNAVEEFLRLTSPIAAFARTAIEPVKVRGQAIEKGDYVVMLYAAANRDEEVWKSPHRCDVTREFDATHVAFGFGEHFCLGAHLARREARLVLDQLLARYSHFELAGPVVRKPSTADVGFESVPIAFTAAR